MDQQTTTSKNILKCGRRTYFFDVKTAKKAVLI